MAFIFLYVRACSIKYIEGSPEPSESEDVSSADVNLAESQEEKSIDNGEKRNYIDLQRIMDTLSEDEQAVVKILMDGQCHVDDIIDRSEIPGGRVSAALTILQIDGYVTEYPGKYFDLSTK